MNNEVRGYFLQIWDHLEAKSIRTKSLSKRAIYKASFKNLDRILRSSSGDFQRAFKQPGLYIITWWGPSRKTHKIYIGKSDQALRNRLRIQRKSNRFQNASEIFLLPFNAHFNYINYFEKRLIKEYQNSVELVNQQINTYMYHADPEGWDLSDSDRSRFDKIITEIKELLTLLSFEFETLFQKRTKYKLPKKIIEPIIKTEKQLGVFSVQKQKYHVHLRFQNPDSKKIYVLKNSYTLHSVRKNYNVNSKYQKDLERIQQQRNELLQKGILQQIDNKLVFTQNYLFNSPSTAGRFITGRSSNGYNEFNISKKTTNYKSPKQIIEPIIETEKQLDAFSVQKQKYHVHLRFQNPDSKKIYVLKNSYTACLITEKTNTNSKYHKAIDIMTKHRDQLLKEGILQQIDNKLVFTQNYLFNTPSAASSFITGHYSSSGNIEFNIIKKKLS